MFALFVVLLIAELWVMVMVAQTIGVLETLGLLIAVGFVGIWLVKRQGLAVFRRLQVTLAEGRVPHRELVDGFLLLMAGVLLVFPPGFITDAVGVLLLLPPVRLAVRGMMVRSFKRRTSIAVRVVDGVGRRFDLRDVRDVRDVKSRDTTEPPRPLEP